MEAFCSHDSFGDMPMIVFGDLLQLELVDGTPAYHPMTAAQIKRFTSGGMPPIKFCLCAWPVENVFLQRVKNKSQTGNWPQHTMALAALTCQVRLYDTWWREIPDCKAHWHIRMQVCIWSFEALRWKITWMWEKWQSFCVPSSNKIHVSRLQQPLSSIKKAYLQLVVAQDLIFCSVGKWLSSVLE